MVRMPCRLSLPSAAVSPTCLCIARARRRTFRPKTMMGITTSGTTMAAMPASCGLVANSSAAAPRNIIPLRMAKGSEEPTTVCSTAVSVVSREMISPVRVTS